MPSDVGKDGRPIVSFASQAQWERWLEDEHASSDGVWLRLAKKGSGIASVTYAEAVESALRYGWIDSQAKTVDERFYVQRFTPRRARSKWSKLNRDKATALIEAGRMTPAGLAQVELAKADGRWAAAYDSPSSASVPDDLRRALEENPKAGEFFASLDGQNRYAILYRLQDAKRPETRARRLEDLVAMLAGGKTFHP